MIGHDFRTALVTLAAVTLLSACVSQRPTWVYTMEASDAAVQAALESEANYPYIFDSNREMVPVFEPPIHLRPCCAFGKDLGVKFGQMPIPMYRVANVVDVDSLGPHVYDAGFAGKGTDNEVKAEENNGLIYTCRGGFIDTAHVRDYADWTVYLAHEFWRSLGKKLTITLPPELGPREIILHPAASADSPLMSCDTSEQPVRLFIEQRLYGFGIEDLVTVQITLDEEHRDAFAFPTDRHRAESRVTQADFQAIANAARVHDAKELGTK